MSERGREGRGQEENLYPHKLQVTDHQSPRRRRILLQVDPGYDYDPMDPMSFNLYGYCRNQPINFLDPTGMYIVLRDGKRRVIYNPKKKYSEEKYGKKISRMAQALKSLADLHPKLNAMVNSLVNSVHSHTLRIVGRPAGPGNNPSDRSVPLNRTAAQTPGMGSGTENQVELNGNEDSEYGGFASPLSRLSHELKHAYDADKGILNLSWIKGIQVAEIRAVYYENLVRARTYQSGQPGGKMRHLKGRLRFRYSGSPITREMFKKALGDDYDKKDF